MNVINLTTVKIPGVTSDRREMKKSIYKCAYKHFLDQCYSMDKREELFDKIEERFYELYPEKKRLTGDFTKLQFYGLDAKYTCTGKMAEKLRSLKESEDFDMLALLATAIYQVKTDSCQVAVRKMYGM